MSDSQLATASSPALPLDNYNCRLCHLLVQYPVTCFNGDLFCLDCIGAYARLLDTVSDDSAVVSRGLSGFLTPTFVSRLLSQPRKSWSRRRSNAMRDWTSNVDGVLSLEGRVVVTLSHVTLGPYDDLREATTSTSNCCPLCGVHGAYVASPTTYQKLADRVVSCPYVSSARAACQWTGCYRAFCRHEHAFGGDNDDGESEEATAEQRVIVDGKIVDLKKSMNRDRKSISMTIKYDV